MNGIFFLTFFCLDWRVFPVRLRLTLRIRNENAAKWARSKMWMCYCGRVPIAKSFPQQQQKEAARESERKRGKAGESRGKGFVRNVGILRTQTAAQKHGHGPGFGTVTLTHWHRKACKMLERGEGGGKGVGKAGGKAGRKSGRKCGRKSGGKSGVCTQRSVAKEGLWKAFTVNTPRTAFDPASECWTELTLCFN